MKPYYQRGDVTIYNGDCLELLGQLPAGSVDLCITDPPYGVGFRYDLHDDSMTPEAWQQWAEKWLRELLRVSPRVLITGQARLPQLARIEPWNWLLQWWKPAAMGRSPVGFCEWEPIAMYGKGSAAGMPDVIRAPIVPQTDTGTHPCPKPLYWAVGQLQRFPNAKMVIDPFTGSGTVSVACIQQERKFIGSELSEEYCEIAARRCDRELDQGRLFKPEPRREVQRELIPA